MGKATNLGILAFIGLLPSITLAQTPQVGDFALIDHRGEFQQISRLGAEKAVVLVTQNLSCSSQPESFRQLEQLQSRYGEAGIQFVLLNTDPGDSREALVEAANAAGSNIPVLLDRALSISESLQADRVAQASDSGMPQSSNEAASACSIEFSARHRHQTEGISFAGDVVPILERRCVSCHSEGGIAPWAVAKVNRKGE